MVIDNLLRDLEKFQRRTRDYFIVVVAAAAAFNVAAFCVYCWYFSLLAWYIVALILPYINR